MAIPIVEATQIINVSSNSTSTGSVGITGLGLQENDIVIAVIAMDGDAANPTATPATYGTITSISEGAVELYYLWKRMGATPDTTITISWTGSEQCRIMLLRISGCILTGDPWDAINSGGTGGSVTVFTLNSYLTTVINTLVIGGVAVDRDRVDSGDGVINPLNSYTNVGTSGSSGGANGAGLIVIQKDMPSIASTQLGNVGTWTADQVAGKMFNLKEEPSALRTEHWQGQIPQPLF